MIPLTAKSCYIINENNAEIIRQYYLYDLRIGVLYLLKKEFKLKLFLADGVDDFFLCHKDLDTVGFKKANDRALQIIFSIPATAKDGDLSMLQPQDWKVKWIKDHEKYVKSDEA